MQFSEDAISFEVNAFNLVDEVSKRQRLPRGLDLQSCTNCLGYIPSGWNQYSFY